MNVFFCLDLKKQYEKINYHLSEIINMYDDIISKINDNTEVDQYDILIFDKSIPYISSVKAYYERQLINNNELIAKTKHRLKHICEHKFIEDSIDIDPDRSQNIRYCSICGYTV